MLSGLVVRGVWRFSFFSGLVVRGVWRLSFLRAFGRMVSAVITSFPGVWLPSTRVGGLGIALLCARNPYVSVF